jgi:hypothetical protein
MHDVDEIEADQHSEAAELPRREDIVPKGGLPPQLAQTEGTDLELESEMHRSLESLADADVEPLDSSDLTDAQSMGGVSSADHTGVADLFDAPTTVTVRAKSPTPDFNRRLNREPDFSTGLEVV